MARFALWCLSGWPLRDVDVPRRVYAGSGGISRKGNVMVKFHIVDEATLHATPEDTAGRPKGVPETGHLSRGRRAMDSRTAVRYLTAFLSAAVAVLYLSLLFLVFDAESRPDAVVTDTTYGAYLFLAVPYLIGAVLAAMTDRRTLWILGAVLQVIVIALFAVFGVGAFEYEALSELRMEVWAAVITSAQVALLGLLSYLAITRRR